jgi:hypothetical protein
VEIVYMDRGVLDEASQRGAALLMFGQLIEEAVQFGNRTHRRDDVVAAV